MNNLEKTINTPTFFVRSERFVRKRKLEFQTEEEAKKFLEMFLISECISGKIYSSAQFKSTQRTINHLMQQNKQISSEELPLLDGKTKKTLDNVIYRTDGKSCLIEEATD